MSRKTVARKDRLITRILRYRTQYLMLLPAIVLVAVFRYSPAWGLLISFFDYNPGLGLSGSDFVGMKYFIQFFTDRNFALILRNTVVISMLNIIFSTVFPITFALLLNELRMLKFKKTVQTISYLPHFVSYVIVANIAMNAFSPNGFIVKLLLDLGVWKEPVLLFGQPKAFWWLIAGINVWKEMGWGAIIYIASIASIDPSIYEAAVVDGAGRFRRIWSITIPGIIPTIVVLFIMKIPDIVSAGFDPSYLLGNSMTWDYSEVIETYVYRLGLGRQQYGLATAVGFAQMVVGIILIVSANGVARKVSDYSIY